MSDEEKDKCLKLLSLFRVRDKPFNELVTEGQLQIFYELVFRRNKRLEVICSTQYGKSLITALASLVITCIQDEVVAIIAPTNEKAKIIMRYYIEHLGDSPLFYSQLEKNTKLERLRQEESKERIILRNGGGIFVLSVQAGNTRKQIEAAMGAGAKIVIQDESCLIPDEAEATVFRMIAGRGEEAFYCKIGNPFYSEKPYSHFFKSFRDPAYKKITIDYEQGLKEGRYTQAFIEEAKKKPHFDILFECKFPDSTRIDREGYSQLITTDELDRAYRHQVDLFGKLLMGVDVSGGGRNYSTIVLRGNNGAKLLYRAQNPDTMSFVGEILNAMTMNGVNYEDVFIDAIGVGKGVYDRVRESFQKEESFVTPNGVNVGEQAHRKDEFINIRAEAYWELRQWLLGGALLERHDSFDELLNIRYKTQSDRRIKIISKEELFGRGVESPDVADALMLTFTRPKSVSGGASVYKPPMGETKKGEGKAVVFRP